MFPRIASLMAGLVASAALLLLPGCGGGGIGPDTREPYGAVLVLLDGNLFRRSTWTQPGFERPESAAIPPDNGKPEITDCVTTDDTNRRDIDGVCFKDNCAVTTGFSLYDNRLGYFSVRFVNNQSLDEPIDIEGLGFNVRVVNADGVEVWNMLIDQADLEDVREEVGHLAAAGADCQAGVSVVISDAFSMYRSLYGRFLVFGPGTGVRYTLPAGDILDAAIAWDGKDRNGNAVPAGDYTVFVDVTVRDPDTGLQWENPEPATLTIAAAPPG